MGTATATRARLSSTRTGRRSPHRWIVAIATLGLVISGTVAPLALDSAQAAPSRTPTLSGSIAGWDGEAPKSSAVTPDGRTAILADTHALVFIDVSARRQVGKLPFEGSARLSVTPDGKTVWAASNSGVSVVEIASRTVVKKFAGDAALTEVFGFSPDGALAYVSRQNVVKAIDAHSYAPIRDLATLTAGSSPGSVSPDGRTIAVMEVLVGTTESKSLSLVNTATGAVAGPIDLPRKPNTADAFRPVFSPDSASVLTANYFLNSVTVVDARAGRVVGDVTGYDGTMPSSIVTTGTTAYVGGFSDRTISVIDIPSRTQIAKTSPLTGPYDRVASLTITPSGRTLLAAGWKGAPSVFDVPFSSAVTRISGADRYSQAVQVSRAAYPSTAPVVYVASGESFPDALSAGPAAAKAGGPLLLTTAASLPDSTSAEIARLKPQKIVVSGGVNTVSDAVYRQLSALAPSIVRAGGADRFESSRTVVSQAFASATTAYLATGSNFPDALSAGSAAASAGAPVILVASGDSVDAATRALLVKLGVTRIKIVGGTASVSAAYESSLRSLGTVTRLGGADRFAASVSVNQDAFSAPRPQAYLVTGVNFPDGLSGLALAAKNKAPLYLVNTDCVPRATLDDLSRLGVTTTTLLGGVNTLTQSVADLVACA